MNGDVVNLAADSLRLQGVDDLSARSPGGIEVDQHCHQVQDRVAPGRTLSRLDHRRELDQSV